MDRRRLLLLLAALAFGAAACEPGPDSKAGTAREGDAAAPPSATASAPRIVSLSPAITTTLLLLGEKRHLVGCSPWCRGTADSTAVVWDGSQIDAERLLALRPTHIVHQSTLGNDPGEELAVLARGRDWSTASWRLDRLDDVRTMIVGLGELLGGDAHERARELAARLDAATAPDENAAALGPALILFSADPPTAFGPGSYVDDLWASLGGTNAISGAAYPELSVEQVARLDPGWIVVVGSDRLLDSIRDWPITASREGRIVHADDAGMLEPGGGLAGAIESLRAELARAAGAARAARDSEKSP
ncbi:MAG: hypothetical protein FJ253_01025 [Phycisphaerae bacterium]|nr:hypothetical protein [Phycisphaerae bacterium]